MDVIPLILTNFNLLTFLRNSLNWWQWYHPAYPVFIVDNGSDYEPLLEFYDQPGKNVTVFRFPENDFAKNLNAVIEEVIKPRFQYYCLSDPDIQPHPATPPNFLSVFKRHVDQYYHRVGFNLITDDLPLWLNEREMIIGNERKLIEGKQVTEHLGFPGYKAPIDTTFALYTTKNSGWHSPMNGHDWKNALRLFWAYHFGWYIDGNNLNGEMEHYFKTAKYRIPGENSIGRNNNRPAEYQ